ncbi:MAG: response regulator [Sphingomonas bacterium]|nr:response regulator [Sphingomonas bacterium]
MDRHAPSVPRILIVDDDPLIIDIIHDTLDGSGYDMSTVRDGLDMMPALWALDPSLVILDCNLPGRPGMMLLEDIRRSAPNPLVPVLMLTGRQGQWNENAAKRHGVDRYLRKPFGLDEFRVTVARLVANGVVAA